MRSNIIDKISPEPNSGCWLWIGSTGDTGYGNFGVKVDGKNKTLLAHRYIYETLIGPISPGLELDHLCRNRCCVNPQHLEPVTSRENTLRGNFPKIAGLYQKSKTHCPQGHEYTDTNTLHKKRGRHCRECHKMYMRIYNKKNQTKNN